MTSRQFAFLTILFGAALVAGSTARPGTWEEVAIPQPQPAIKVIVAAPVAFVPAETEKQIRVILPSPYETR